ncbi:MAG: hypothetical protein ACD_49C00049G0008 [uncultured bacterium (gcode 4)]|uniref:Uncharacterized protein n=1 Tax=uncultured bacterium (gcode 4) TaxID=1234023 RepID=K2AE95_9BACT|nr:MAG: hypothetical protein ACD_49C00049G0008 [uncultured bacterium (gcode 4)]
MFWFWKKKESIFDIIKKNISSQVSLWLLPIFFWILYQFNALQYTNLSFFSYSQVINDTIVFLPITLTFFLGIFWSYYFILLNKNKQVQDCLYIVFIIVISCWIIYFLKDFKTTWNNFIDILFLSFWYLALSNLLFLWIYWIYILFWSEQKDNIYKWLNWVKKSKYLIIFSIVLWIFFISYLSKMISQNINKNLCIEHFWKVFNVKYINDKYIFTDNLIFKNDKSVYYQNYICDKANDVNIKYFKPSWKCIKINWFPDNNMDYLETDDWLIKNKWYDLYLSWKCIDDK